MDGLPSIEDVQRQQMQAAEQEERRASIIDQILQPDAKQRLNRLKLVKPDKARSVEDSLIGAATSGKLKGQITEEQLIVMLEQISGGSSATTASAGTNSKKGITIQRRKYDDDDDDDNDNDLM